MTDITWDLGDLSAEPTFRGAIDGMNDGWIFGWSIEAAQPPKPVEVRIFLYGEPVLTGLCDIARDDISRLIGQPVTAGFSVALSGIGAEDRARLLARLNADGPGDVPIAEILRIEVGASGKGLPFSAHVGTIRREDLYKSLAPTPDEFPGGAVGKQRLLDTLAPGDDGQPCAEIVAYYTAAPWPGPETTERHQAPRWTDIAAARPAFEGHVQPRIPADLGFYDLRIDQVHRDQVALARRHGVAAFCYEVWDPQGPDAGMRTIERHIALDLELGFCLKWVIGAPKGYQEEIDAIRAFLPAFRAPRYHRLDEAPLLLIDAAHRLSHPAALIDHWRRILRDEGFAGLHVSIIEHPGHEDPLLIGADSSCQNPQQVAQPLVDGCPPRNANLRGLAPDHGGRVQDYADILRHELARPAPAHRQFRVALPGWDDTPARGSQAHVLAGASPELFQTWLTQLVIEAQRRHPEGGRLIFVHGWNDWATGAVLEPDREHGHARLRAIEAALAPEARGLAPLAPPPPGEPDPLAETRRLVERLRATNRVLTRLIARGPVALQDSELTAFVPVPEDGMRIERLSGQLFAIESVNGRLPSPTLETPVALWQGLAVSGWFLIDERSTAEAMLGLRSLGLDGTRYLASIPSRQERADVVKARGLGRAAQDSGFKISASLQGVPPGRYEVELIAPSAAGTRRALAIATDLRLILG